MLGTNPQVLILSGCPVATNAPGDPGSFTLENLLKRRGAGSRSPKSPPWRRVCRC